MALLPAWARSYIEDKKGAEGENAISKPLLSSDTLMAYKYGWFLGNRYKTKNNIIWILGGEMSGAKKMLFMTI